MQDSKPRDWADRGTDAPKASKAPIKSTGATNATPGGSNVKTGVHTSGTTGRKTFPKLSK